MDIKVDNESIQQIIESTIKARVAEALAAHTPRIIDRMVDTALAAKVNSYDRTTILESEINKGLRESAVAAAREWLDEQKPLIAKKVRERLGRNGKALVDSVVEQLVGGLTGRIDVSVFFKRD